MPVRVTVFIVTVVAVIFCIVGAHPALDIFQTRLHAAQRDVDQKCQFDFTIDRTLDRRTRIQFFQGHFKRLRFSLVDEISFGNHQAIR